jgi:hypothetical protein
MGAFAGLVGGLGGAAKDYGHQVRQIITRTGVPWPPVSRACAPTGRRYSGPLADEHFHSTPISGSSADHIMSSHLILI